MGSLMSGWDSPRSSKGHKRSLTREGIEEFWRTHSEPTTSSNGIRFENKTKEALRSKSFNGIESKPEVEVTVRPPPTSTWWTKTDFAFLNESPVEAMDGPKYKYASQYLVAKPKEINLQDPTKNAASTAFVF